MTTFATQDDARRQASRNAREREAWEEYRDSLRGLEGREYADREDESWSRLQRRLDEAGSGHPEDSGTT